MTAPWNRYAAELADTKRSQQYAQPRRPCLYCGTPTRARSQVCPAHNDLPALEQAAATDGYAVEALPQRHLAAASSSAASSPTGHVQGRIPDGLTAGIRGSGLPVAAALITARGGKPA